MAQFLDLLGAGMILVADGATGTNLHKAGMPAGTHPEDWVLDQPDKILALEKSFVRAGSNVILTCTFGATRVRLKGAIHETEASQINRRAVGLAQEAASTGSNVLVAGSIGPLGQLLRPLGPLTVEEATAAYREQAEALCEGGVDLFVIETQYDIQEVDAALSAVRATTEIPVVVSFSYDRGLRTMMGVRPSNVATRFAQAGIAALGANCGTTLENAEQVLREYASAAPGFPIWAKPNAGLPRIVDGQTVYDVTPIQMGEFARRAVDLGARAVGGCCGSTPAHIAEMAAAVRGH